MIAQEAPRGLMIECKEVGKPAEFANMNADELREFIRTQLEMAGLSVSAPREEGGNETAGVPPGMWLEFARRDLQLSDQAARSIS